MPTIRDVARACNVSPMTVSFVLNNKTGQVSAETRERVLKAVRDMGYRLAALDRAPEERTILTLGVVAGIAGDSLMQPGYYSAIMEGLLHAADALQHNITVFTNSLLHTDTHQSIRTFCDGRCDGLFVISPHLGSPLVAALQERGVPFVLIGDTGDVASVPYVDVDNLYEAERIVAYLHAQGHRRIAFLGGPDFVRSANQRLEGYRKAIRAQGLILREDFAIGNVYREVENYDNARTLMRLPAEARPTALFCWNDTSAAHALHACREMGLRIPDDVSIIGFDDHPSMAALDPPMTTMRQPYREIGRTAFDILLAQLRNLPEIPLQAFLPAERMERASVGPPP